MDYSMVFHASVKRSACRLELNKTRQSAARQRRYPITILHARLSAAKMHCSMACQSAAPCARSSADVFSVGCFDALADKRNINASCRWFNALAEVPLVGCIVFMHQSPNVFSSMHCAHIISIGCCIMHAPIARCVFNW